MERVARALFVLLLLLSGSRGGEGAGDPIVLLEGALRFPAAYRELEVRLVRIEFLDERGRTMARSNAGADGSYGVRLLRGETYVLRVNRLYLMRGRVMGEEFSLEPDRVTIPAAGPVAPFRAVLRMRRGTGRVRVVARTRDGAPIAGVRVALDAVDVPRGYCAPHGIAKTDRDGIAEFVGLPSRMMEVKLVDPGPFARIPASRPVRRVSGEFIASVAVRPAETVDATFELHAAGALEVRVDVDGTGQVPALAVWDAEGTRIDTRECRPDRLGATALYRIDGLVPGGYRLVTTYPDARTAARDAVVRAGRVTPVLLGRSARAPTGLEVRFRWDDMPRDVRRARIFVTPWPLDGETTVYESVRGGSLRRLYGPAIAARSYLVRYPERGLARRLTVELPGHRMVDLTPPPPGFVRGGRHTITVRLFLDGAPVDGVFVGLRPRRDGEEEPWMRYVGTAKGVARLDGVPGGLYELFVADRVLGGKERFRTVTHGIRIAGDQTVEWELRDRAR